MLIEITLKITQRLVKFELPIVVWMEPIFFTTHMFLAQMQNNGSGVSVRVRVDSERIWDLDTFLLGGTETCP